MVNIYEIRPIDKGPLSVLALSSRFDGLEYWSDQRIEENLSVLALSSRFDGRCDFRHHHHRDDLSVLALSSRFDGHLWLSFSAKSSESFSTRSVESF